METHPRIKQMDEAVSNFTAGIEELPAARFLQPLHAWTPRDIVAHLIGWNRLFITGLDEIRRGELPAYFDDAGHDYAHVNAELVARYAATDRELLLAELQASGQALQRYLSSLAPDDWQADFGARYRGSPLAIESEVADLIEDYDDHREEIQAWAGTSPAALTLRRTGDEHDADDDIDDEEKGGHKEGN